MAQCHYCGRIGDGKYCSNCGKELHLHEADDLKTGLKAFADQVPMLLRIDAALNFFFTCLRPINELKKGKGNIKFSESLSIYLQLGFFAQYISLKFKYIHEKIGIDPAANPVVENDLLFSILITGIQALVLLLFFILPKSILYPNNRLEAISTLYLASGYGAIYGVIFGAFGILLTKFVGEYGVLFTTYFGLIFILLFTIVVMRRVLELSFWRIIIVLLIQNIASGLLGFLIAYNL